MKQAFNTFVRPLIRRLGVDLVRYRGEPAASAYPRDFNPADIHIYERVKAYTMTSPEMVNALVEAVRYVAANRIEGAMVECGVWKGGSAMAIALALQELGDTHRQIYLYDTFAGMSSPSEADVSIGGCVAKKRFTDNRLGADSSNWCLAPLDEVRNNMQSTGYPQDRVHYVAGKVEDTLPQTAPQNISLLRLDTDWYESTKHELVHLFPLLSPNGVLIIDDYGKWKGARKAVDEYIRENNTCILLNRIDYTGRIAVKSR